MVIIRSNLLVAEMTAVDFLRTAKIHLIDLRTSD